tara:strand:- start:6 stop:944 length:939 start_codon:yes stop_codon:yes gene_type:complete
MAVYTTIDKKDIEHLFEDIGEINELIGITEGVENTNYLIKLKNNKKFIFTIFEKRTKASDLPFFNNAMKEFKDNGINCPVAINVKNQNIFSIKKKPCAIYSFIEGNQITSINDKILNSLSSLISHIHKVGFNSKLKRENNMLKPSWIYILNKFNNYDGSHSNELKEIKNEISNLENKFPRNIRHSLIHADLFKDNIFFQNDEVSGIIDFFFTCSDSIVYDLATFINAWFFKNNNFDESNFSLFMTNYLNQIDWNNEEKDHLNFYLKASAIRFFLTRLHDKYHNNHGDVVHKDPLEFYEIMNFHLKNNLQDFI